MLDHSTQMAGIALAHNQFDAAKAYEELGKNAELSLSFQADTKIKDAADKSNTLGAASLDYVANPSEAGYKQVRDAAITAGKDPKTIPSYGDPKFAAVAQGWTSEGKDNEARVKHLDEVQRTQDAAEEKKRAFQAEEARKIENDRSTALARENQHLDRQLTLQVLREGQQLRKQESDARIAAAREKTEAQRQSSGEKLTSAERTMVTGVVGAVGEATRGIRNVLAMPVDTTSGAFQSLHSSDVIGSLTKVGGNIVTPESTQMYTATTRGLGMEIGRALTLGGGRGVTQAQIDEFESMVQAQPGDTEFTAMYKLSNAADILKNRLETLPDSPIKKVREEQDKYMAELKKIPSPMEIWAAAQKNPKAKEQLTKIGTSMEKSMSNVRGAIQNQDAAVSKAAEKSAVPMQFKVIGGVTYHETSPGKWSAD